MRPFHPELHSDGGSRAMNESPTNDPQKKNEGEGNQLKVAIDAFDESVPARTSRR